MKQQILRELDEDGLLVGHTIQDALLANDRAKYLLTLLQLAFEQAHNPQSRPDTLARERRLVDIDENALDRVIPSARRGAHGGVSIEGVECVTSRLEESCRTMLQPIRAAGAEEAAELETRLERLVTDALPNGTGEVSDEWLDHLTRGTRGRGDSVHLFVMDAHRVINRIQRDLSHSRVDGVVALGLEEDDRELVRAFVGGVRRTSALRLDHPGLDTTAGRYGGRLVIQNDVGVTDSHVIVLSVTEGEIEITYTDIHGRRLAFFRRLLGELDPQWKEIHTRSSTALEEGEQYFVLTGTIRAETPEQQRVALDLVGSRLVFLIDWNKARKRLRTLLGNKSASRVLEEAARAEVGHMAFLKLGGEELVYQALDVVGTDYLRYGEPFQSAVGSAAAEECFTEVLRTCHEGIDRGDSLQVIRDRVVTHLSRALRSRIPGGLAACRRQAGFVVEAALTLQHVMRFMRARRDHAEFVTRSHRRIAAWENEADDLLNRLRRRESRRPSGMPLRELSGAIDDALDAIDRAAFFLTRVAVHDSDKTVLASLEELAGILVRAAQEFYKAIAATSETSAGRSGDDLAEFFESVGRLDALTKTKDGQEREFLEQVFESQQPPGCSQRLREIGAQICEAVDSLARAGFVVYDSIFGSGRTVN